MNSEQTSTQPHSKLAPLGQKLKALKLGEHIIIEYGADLEPTFTLAMNHYRKYLEMGFRYEEKELGVYDVWLESATNEPIDRTGPLGKQLKALQFGQRLIVEHEAGSHKSFQVTMAHHRKYLKKGFLYEQKGPTTYEVWLGTREEARAAHRGLRHVQECLTETELMAMKSTPTVSSDWVTIVLLAMRCGIAATTGRRLLWENVLFEQQEIEVTMRNARYPVRRLITGDLLDHLKSIRTQNDGKAPLCPVLSNMSNKEYTTAWLRVRSLLGLPASRTLSALTWPWKQAHPGQRDREILLNHIAALEKKWLSPAELVVASKIRILSNGAATPTTK